MPWTRLTQVVKAKNVRVGDYVLMASGEFDSENLPTFEWRRVTDADNGHDGVSISYGEGWENQCTFDDRARLVVLQK